MIQKWHLHLCWNFLCLIFFFHLFICSHSLSQYPNNYFSFPWSFYLILGIHLHLSAFACGPLSSPCRMPHLVLRSLMFVPSLSSSPTCRHCPPSPELLLFEGGRWRGGIILPYSLTGHPPQSFFSCVSTPWNLPPPSCCDPSLFLPASSGEYS